MTEKHEQAGRPFPFSLMAHPTSLSVARLLAFALLVPFLHAEEGWVDLFNGKDLSGWVNVNGAPETWTAHDGIISCTGKPIGALRTEKPYENFELELEWRHLKPAGNAGVFIWAPTSFQISIQLISFPPNKR